MKREPLTRESREKLLGEIQYRDLVLDRAAVNEDARTVPASMSSEAPVRRWFGNEILKHEAGAVNLERAQGGALPMLWGHDTDSLLGAAEGFTLSGNRLAGQLRFSKNAVRSEVWEQIREGMPLGISIGYRIDEWQESADSDDVTVTRWTLHEVSVVTVPADTSVGIGRSLERTTKMNEPTAGNAGNPAPAPAVEGPAHVRLVKNKGIEEGVAQERERVSEIRNLFVMPGFQTDDHIALREWAIDSGLSVEQARTELLKMAGSGVSPVASVPPVQRQYVPPIAGPGGYQEHAFGRDSQIRFQAGADQRDKWKEGASRAIELRADLIKDPAERAKAREGNEFLGLPLVEIARQSLIRNNLDVRGLSPMALVGMALTSGGSFMRAGPSSHGVSDFANLLLDAANKSMIGGWTENEETYRAWVKVISANDFKATNLVNRSNFGNLDVVPEFADYKYGTLSDVKETVTLRTYGKLFKISRQAIINDDLGAFTEIPMLMGRAAARMCGDEAYAVLTGNPTMAQDSIALFDVNTHGNYVSSGGAAPSVTTLNTGFAAMATRTDPGGTTLNIRPRFMLTPVALEATGRTLAAAVYDPAGTAGTLKPNPFQGHFEVIADARLDTFNSAGWFLLANPATNPCVVIAFLNGSDAPFIEQQDQFTQDGVSFKVRLDVRAAAADFRTAYYNDGA